MKLYVSNEICFENYTTALLDFCRRNLIVNNPDYTKKMRMGLYVGNTPKVFELFRIDGCRLYVPYGCAKLVKDFIAECDFKQIMLNSGRITDFGCHIPLYDYQQKAVESMLRAGGGILKSKAGSGKTQMGIGIIAGLNCKTLWLTHTADLLKQSYERTAQYIDRDRLGKITAGKVHINDITFATVQTMCKLDLTMYRNTFGCIIVDECHRAAGTPTRVTRFSKVIGGLAARYKYGLSATVHRSDGLIKSLYALLGNVEYTVPDDVVRVMQPVVKKISLPTKQSNDYCDYDGTIVYAHFIGYLAENDQRNKAIAANVNRNECSLILSDRKKQLKQLAELIPQSVVVTGETTPIQRLAAFEGIKTGKFKILLSTYALAKEGLDIPCLTHLHMATPVKDYAVVVQSVGRIARNLQGKHQPVVYDYVDGNIGIAEKMWKQRCSHYKKEGIAVEVQ